MLVGHCSLVPRRRRGLKRLLLRARYWHRMRMIPIHVCFPDSRHAVVPRKITLKSSICRSYLKWTVTMHPRVVGKLRSDVVGGTP